MLSADSYDSACIQSYLNFTRPLAVEREIICIAAQTSVNATISEIKKQIPDREQVNVSGQQCDQLHGAWQRAVDVTADTLVVLAVSEFDGIRIYLGTEPDAFAHSIDLPAIFFLPSEADRSNENARYYGKLSTI